MSEIKERYETLGGKYLTMYQHEDGRFVNGMMYTDRIENCLEEIVDAAFCMVGWIFKCKAKGLEEPYVGLKILGELVQIYEELKAEKANGTYS